MCSINSMMQSMGFTFFFCVCANFNLFWQTWQWWEVGKTQIKVFCQQYICYSSKRMENMIKELESEILEKQNKNKMLERHENQLQNVICEKNYN